MRRYSFVLAALLAPAAVAAPESKMLLRQNWAIQSSADVPESGAALSVAGFRPPRAWYPATLPTTVFSALVAAHVYPDPYFGMNLRSAPGVKYPIGFNFSNAPMPPDSPFRQPWWFRTEFKLPAEYRGKTLWLGFDGINFRANVWLNGKQIAASDKLAGAWRLFEFDVTAAAKPGETNALAIEIFPPEPDDLAITFVDWNPHAAGQGHGPLARCLDHRHRSRRHPLPRGDHAPRRRRRPTRRTRRIDQCLRAARRGRAQGQDRKAGVFAARETGRARNPRDPLRANSRSRIRACGGPRRWARRTSIRWTSRSRPAARSATRSHTEFGIREVTSELDAKGHRLFHINGKNILIRGAGYTFDMLLRSTPERQEAELRYVRDMNLNAVRFEGKLEDDHFLELCDRYGHPGAGRLVLLRSLGAVGSSWDEEDEVDRRRVPARSAAPPGSATRRCSTGCTAATIRRRPRSSRCTST